MNFELEKIKSTKVLYMRNVGPYGPKNKQLMNDFKELIEKNNLCKEDSVILGIIHDNMAVTAPQKCRYDVALMVEESGYKNRDDRVRESRLKGGEYAVFEISHTEKAIQDAWIQCFGVLASEGVVLDETRPILERYRAALVKDHFCEICVPVL